MSRKTYAGIGTFVGAIVLVVIGVFMLEMVFSRQSTPPAPSRKRAESAPEQRAWVATTPFGAGLHVATARAAPRASQSTFRREERARA